MTVSLERIAPEDWPAVERMRQALQSLVIDTGLDPTTKQPRSVSIRFGTGTAVFTASQASATVTIPHGLATTPVFAIASTRNNLIGYAVTGRSATTISVIGFVTVNTVTTNTLTFDWAVIG
jgi:hypothetical protein